MAKQKLGPKQQAWIKALRSGRYKQIKNRLRTSAGFCCLGVACEVVGLPFDDPSYAGETTYLPWQAVNTMRFRADNGEFLGLPVAACGGGNFNTLVCLNDKGMTFAEIADLVESRPEDFFVEPA